MRIPLGVSIESRDGTRTKDAIIINGIVETKGEQSVVRKRPGISDMGLVRAGVAQLLYVWNGIKLITGDYLSTGTIGTIISGPTSTNLTPTNASLHFDAQETNSDASTPRLMIKNRTQAWTVNRAGTIAAVTYGGTMGAGTYNLISLTRSGTTATATLAEDVFNVGDAVTIAGAGEAAYNGAQTITAVTEGSFTPAVTIPVTITRSGTTATATSASAHGLSTGTYTLSGANQSEYNGSKSITVTSSTTFTFTVTVTTPTGIGGTWNSADKDSTVTLSGSDLVASITDNLDYGMVRGTVGKSTGTWYFEVTVTSSSQTFPLFSVGVALAADALTGSTFLPSQYCILHSGHVVVGGTTVATLDDYVGVGDVVGVKLNMTAGTIEFFVNGVRIGGGSGLSGTYYPAVGGHGGPTAFTLNTGATAFTYNYDEPITPATGNPIVTKAAVTVNPTFTYTVAGSPSTPATGTITAQGNGGTVPGIPYINGYFFVMDANGVMWHSDSDDPTTWNALNFLVAQNENGAGRALAKSQNYLIAFKEWSTEFFYDAGNATGFAFSPLENGFTRVGCAIGTSVIDLDGTLIWMSQTKGEGRAVHMMRGLEQQKISNPDIERILDRDDLSTVYAFPLTIDGHSLYVLTLVGSTLTLVYDLTSGHWYRWLTYTQGNSVSVSSITRSGTTATVTTSTAHGLTDGSAALMSGATQNEYNGLKQIQYLSTTTFAFEVDGEPTTPATGTIVVYPYTASYFEYTKAVCYNGVTLLLHKSDGHLYQMLTTVYEDDGGPIDFYIRTARLDGGSTNRKILARLRLIGSSVDSSAMIRWSDDDATTWKAFRPVDLSSNEPELRRCGAFSRRTFEIRHIANTQAQFEALELEMA